jgi:hypothetical protein
MITEAGLPVCPRSTSSPAPAPARTVERATPSTAIRFFQPDWLGRIEWTLAILISATALFLLFVRATNAGALWRDECAVVQLAQMPTLSDIAHNFQHEAFPLLFPAAVRGYIALFGASDAALRGFGIVVGVLLIGALWFVAWTNRAGPPLISVALLGLNVTFLVWGTSVRGYGLGCVLIVVAFGCFVKALTQPSPVRVAAAALTSLAAVQCLLYNLVLLIALTLSASFVWLVRRQPRRMIVFLSILALCMISFVPYIGPYSSGSAWSAIVEFPINFRFLWLQLNFAMGNPNRMIAIPWYLACVTLLGAATWRLYLKRDQKSSPEWNLLLFGSLVLLSSLFGYYEFLRLLSYIARSWYFLALLALIAIALEFLAGALSNLRWARVSRLIFAAGIFVILPFNAWPKLTERQTNIDIVSKKVAELAKPNDLIVVAPWQYGISFGRYYHGATRWITLPTIADLRVHRYDLMMEKMTSPHPIDDVLATIGRTLSTGNRVWFVGGIQPPDPSKRALSLPPASDNSFGGDNISYSESWMEQMSVFVREHSERGQTVQFPTSRPVNQYEDVPLLVVQGWQ